jgi:putative ABC transport system permease protein
MDHWRPVPRFYDLSLSHYGKPEQLFVPFSTSRELKLPHSGVMNCWGSDGGEQTDANAPCTWVQFWVQLDTPQKATAYREFLQSYSELQRREGRFERPANVRLRNVEEWLDFNRVVPGDVRLQTWLALGFLLVCMLNTVGLLLAKFLGRSAEVSVRRALGASRRTIFSKYIVEAGAIGLAGGFIGLLLTLFGLWVVRQQPSGHADLINLDLPMLVLNFSLALAVSLMAGLLPAWRACAVEPSIELKSQ